MNSKDKFISDYVVIGTGMVGMSIAYELLKLNSDASIIFIEKEKNIGLHSSGRNSGVLHAGIYYKPNSLRAKLCIEGAKLLKNWCLEENINVLNCGKYIVPQRIDLDDQIDNLKKRADANGAETEIINSREFKKNVPFGRTASGRALWSPNTSVVNPIEVLIKLRSKLEKYNVKFYYEHELDEVNEDLKIIKVLNKNLNKKINIRFGHLFNAAGLQADKIAKKFNLAKHYEIFPFKGIYWRLNPNSKIKFNTNLYPVPDLNVPFLGVHVTPSVKGDIYLGPTAIPAFGRENYKFFENIEPFQSLNFLKVLVQQYIQNKNGFRKYSREQAFHGIKLFFYKSAKEIIPELQLKDLLQTNKVGIRSQLYDFKENSLIDDFVLQEGDSSTHILNAISPAFTASFAFAKYVLKNSNFRNSS